MAGVVHRLTFRSEGEVIEPGEAILEIVPENARVFAEVDILAERIGGISAGQKASLKILTYDFTRYGEIVAQVERISPPASSSATAASYFAWLWPSIRRT